MNNSAKKYNYCPLCPFHVQLKKVEGKKYTYECPSCGLRIYPNRLNYHSRHFKKDPKIRVPNPVDLGMWCDLHVDVWAAEAERSFDTYLRRW